MPYARIQVDSYFRYCIIVISVYDRDRDRDRLRLSINTVNRHLGFRGFASTTCKIVPTPATLCKHALATPLEVSSFVAIVTNNNNNNNNDHDDNNNNNNGVSDTCFQNFKMFQFFFSA